MTFWAFMDKHWNDWPTAVVVLVTILLFGYWGYRLLRDE